MPSSPIRRLSGVANAAARRGLSVYYLNIGQPDIHTPREALEAVENIHLRVLAYSPSDGLESLRKKFSEYYHRFGLDISPDEIIVTAGGSEAVLFAFMACLDPGDEIIVPEPAYANYMAFADSAGIRIRPLPSNIHDGFALPPVEDFEKKITNRTRAILLCNPNNPTGYVYTRKELEARNEVKWETYTKKIQIEARVLGDLAMNHIIPVATEYQSKLIDNVYKMKELFPAEKASQLSAENMKLIEEIARRTIFITEHVNAMVEARKVANKIESEREKAIAYHDTIAPMLEEIRYHIDKLELIVDNQMWTLPKYRELLFIR